MGEPMIPAMTQAVSVHLLPDHCPQASLPGSIAVVLDILRASTTIVHALAAGAEAVIPCGSVDAARTAAANLPPGAAVLGGERGGVKIDGFDFGNSPLEYIPERVGGKTVVFTTTNGTRALQMAAAADRILIGAVVNASAVAQELVKAGRPVQLLCAGTDGAISREDVLCAGWIVSEMQQESPAVDPTDAAVVARDFALHQRALPHGILLTLRDSHGGRNLVELGYDADIERSAEIDRFDIVPEFNAKTGRLTASPASA